MRILSLAVLLLLLPGLLRAAVYRDKACTFHQPDGTSVPVRITGDEYVIDAETMAGWSVLRRADGWWCYARPAAGGGIDISELRAGLDDPRGLGTERHLRQSRVQRQAAAEARRASMPVDPQGRLVSPRLAAQRAWRAQRAGQARPAADGPHPSPDQATTGERRGVTLLIAFPDRPADAWISQAEVDGFCNGDAYTGFGNNGSVKRYFADNSLGRLTYTSSVTAYYTAAQPRSYYADPNASQGMRARQLVVEALNHLDATGFDFRTCDRDGDGVIDAVNAFYAGDCPNNWAEGLWPHQWTVDWTSNDGIATAAYQISDMGMSGLELGTFCHENGHQLCDFPDIYDYNYDSVGGAGVFCLMNSGSFGSNPVRVCGYLALSAGWRDAIDIPSGFSGSLTAEAEAAGIFRYRKPGDLGEYFLIENRFAGSASGRDAGLPCSGLAIWHCDEAGNHNRQGYGKPSPSAAHYEVALIQADNQHHFERAINHGDSGDLWYQGNPAGLYAGRFADGAGISATANDARWWDASPSSLVIADIGASGQVMAFACSALAPPAAGIIQVGSESLQAFEGDAGLRMVQVQVYRTGGGAGAVSVAYATVDGSAHAGEDYQAVANTLAWGPGETGARTIDLRLIGDGIAEPDEAFTLALSAPAGGAALGAAACQVVIRNDDAEAAALASAVDLVAATIIGSGQVPWFAQDVDSHDGIDAARSGAISEGESSSLVLAIDGPSTLSWWWKVSSESGWDFLRCTVDGVMAVPAISGEVGWTRCQVGLTAGQHTVAWIYAKDSTLSLGLDAGFVDQVEVVAPRPGSIALDPVAPVVLEGHEGATVVQLVVRRLEGTGGDVGASCRIVGGTATPGVDAILDTTRVSWGDGDASPRTITLRVCGDWEAETDETVEIELLDATGGAILGFASATVTIRDDDAVPRRLAEAVDTSEAEFAVTEAHPWSVVTSPSVDGVDAVRSAPIGPNEHSDLTCTISGPAMVSYWAKVSSEPYYDGLSVLVDGEPISFWLLSGEQDWQPFAFPLSSGAHQVTWRYSKDFIDDVVPLIDAAFLDQVTVDCSQPGVVLLDQTQMSVVEGDAETSLVRVIMRRVGGTTGSLSITYQTIAGTARAGSDYQAQSGTLTWAEGDAEPQIITIAISGDTVSESDESFSVVSAPVTDGVQFGIPSVMVTIRDDDATVVPGLGAAIGQPDREIRSGGSAVWSVVGDPSHDGADVARSGMIGDGQESWMSMPVDGPAQVSWWWKVSSEYGFDFLAVNIDGAFASSISGSQEWQQVEVEVPAGSHTMRWTYHKDESVSAGLDAGFVDEVVIEPLIGGMIIWSATEVVVQERVAGGVLVLTAERVGDGAGFAQASYATSDGSATAGSDFLPIDGAMTWGDGETGSRSISIPILVDADSEGDEYFSVAFVSIDGAALGGGLSYCQVTIRDDVPIRLRRIAVRLLRDGVGLAGIPVTCSVPGSAAAPQSGFTTADGGTGDGEEAFFQGEDANLEQVFDFTLLLMGDG